MHAALKSHRHSSKREFFKVSPERALSVIEKLSGEIEFAKKEEIEFRKRNLDEQKRVTKARILIQERDSLILSLEKENTPPRGAEAPTNIGGTIASIIIGLNIIVGLPLLMANESNVLLAIAIPSFLIVCLIANFSTKPNVKRSLWEEEITQIADNIML